MRMDQHVMASDRQHSHERSLIGQIQPFGDGFFFQILAHPVFKMRVIQKPNKVAL